MEPLLPHDDDRARPACAGKSRPVLHRLWLILAAGALGGIAGGLLGERIVRFLGPARTTQLTILWSVPSFIGVALAPDAVSLGIVMFLFEFAGLVWNTVSVSTRQRMIPDRLLGRVNSAYRLLAWGMIPLGLALSGSIVRLADGPLPRGVALTLPFWVAAAGVLVTTIFGWRPLARGLAPAGRQVRGRRAKMRVPLADATGCATVD